VGRSARSGDSTGRTQIPVCLVASCHPKPPILPPQSL
jgi:hypothetical protein